MCQCCGCRSVTLTIGRFDFDRTWKPDFWIGGYRWQCKVADQGLRFFSDESPEEKHYEFLKDESRFVDWEDEYAGDLQRLLDLHPFEQPPMRAEGVDG